MENPFDILNERLNKIENLLLSIKDEKAQAQEDKAEYLSKKQIKERYNIAPATIDYNARMGYLERYYFGRLVRFKVTDIEALFSNKSYVAEAAKQRILKRSS